MKKKPTPPKAKKPDPLQIANPVKFTRAVQGTDERGIPYRKAFFSTANKDYTTTTYGTPPDDSDERSVCRLIRRQKGKEKPRWTFEGNFDALLKGEAARTHLQRLWNSDPSSVSKIAEKLEELKAVVLLAFIKNSNAWALSVLLRIAEKLQAVSLATVESSCAWALSVLRSAESVRRNRPRVLDSDAEILGRAMIRAITGTEADRRLVKAAISIGAKGLLTPDDERTLPRPWRIATAIKKFANKHDRIPSVEEAFEQFKANESAIGRGVEHLRIFYRDLHEAGFGWLARST